MSIMKASNIHRSIDVDRYRSSKLSKADEEVKDPRAVLNQSSAFDLGSLEEHFSTTVHGSFFLRVIDKRDYNATTQRNFRATRYQSMPTQNNQTHAVREHEPTGS